MYCALSVTITKTCRFKHKVFFPQHTETSHVYVKIIKYMYAIIYFTLGFFLR